MTTLKATAIEKDLSSKVEEPFKKHDDIDKNILVDMTDYTGITGKALRVELRRTRDPATGKPSYKRKLVDPNCIVGLLSPDELPEEGKVFKLPYHSLNDLADFGKVDSKEPIKNLVRDGDCFYFTTSEGEWRLRILAGN